MADRPCNSERIIKYAFGGLPEEDLAFAEVHVADCAACREALNSLIAVAAGGNWREEPSSGALPPPDAIESARQILMRDAMSRERASEDSAWLIGLPASARIKEIVRNREKITAALAWNLKEEADSLRFTAPRQALPLYELAAFIADAAAARGVLLSHELRAEVWKNYAWLLADEGHFEEAESAIEWADDAAQQCSPSRHVRAIVALTRGIVLSHMQRWRDALPIVTAARQTFAELGDEERRLKAVEQEANILMKIGDLGGAIYRLSQIVELDSDDATRARRFLNIGYALENAGATWPAGEYLARAKAIYARINQPTMMWRVEWGLARILAKANRLEEACERYEAASHGFRSLGSTDSAVRLDLDWSECEVENRIANETTYERLRGVAVYAVEKRLPVAQCSALEYLKDLGRNVDIWHIRHVREFIDAPTGEPFRPPKEL